MKKKCPYFFLIMLLLVIRYGRAQNIDIDLGHVISEAPVYFGWEGGWINEDSALFMERYRLAPPKILRIQVPMFLFEPVNDNNDPHDSQIRFNLDAAYDVQYGKHINYDTFLKKIVAEFPDIKINLNIWDCANWLASTPGTFMGGISGAFPPTDYEEYEEFIRSLAFWITDSIGVRPVNILLTFVNEPNAASSFPTSAFSGTVADLVLMARHARAALDDASADIQMGGIEEYMSTSMTHDFMNAGGNQYVDFLSFHVYGNGINSVNQRINDNASELSVYHLPVFLTELGDQAYGPSIFINYNSPDAGIDLTRNLICIWKSSLSGFTMFRLNNSYMDNPLFGLSGWVGYGVFEDWRGTHTNGKPYELFPGFWAFAAFYKFLGSAEILNASSSSSDIDCLAAKNDTAAYLLAVNSDETSTRRLNISLINAGTKIYNKFIVFNSLVSQLPVDSGLIVRDSFSYVLPPKSSRLFLLKEERAVGINTQFRFGKSYSSKFQFSVFPNPFNAQTTIQYTLDQPQKIFLQLYDCIGRIVFRSKQDIFSAGRHSLIFDGEMLSSGIYYVRISGTSFSSCQKIVLLK